MGIDTLAAQFLRHETRKGLALGNILTLGHQSIYMEAEAYRVFMKSVGGVGTVQRYADDLFHALGAKSIDVMDVSDYEGANVLHDLNQPVSEPLWGQYDVVFDGGALEHVFNFPIAFKNCLEMVKVGGRFISVTPANDFCGHGFYQFSPELFFSSLTNENGFSIECVLFSNNDRWYSVIDPAKAKSRVQMKTGHPILLCVIARKIEEREIFRVWPQQSDYIHIWGADDPSGKGAKTSIKDELVKKMPLIKKIQTKWKAAKYRRQCSPKNRDWFAEVDINAD